MWQQQQQWWLHDVEMLPHYWPFVRGTAGHRWFPSQRVSNDFEQIIRHSEKIIRHFSWSINKKAFRWSYISEIFNKSSAICRIISNVWWADVFSWPLPCDVKMRLAWDVTLDSNMRFANWWHNIDMHAVILIMSCYDHDQASSRKQGFIVKGHVQTVCGSGHETAAVLLPGFAISW